MKQGEFAELGLRYKNSAGQQAPDIWSCGIVPLSDYVHILAAGYDEQFRHEPISERMDNYCYIRAKNFAQSDKMQRIACLYYTIPQLICQPDLWVNIPTDSGANFSPFPKMKPGDIAAAKEPFMLRNAEPATGYELIAQINDRTNTLNPKPRGLSAVERAQLFDSPLCSKCYIPMQDAPSPYLLKTRLSINVTAEEKTVYLLTLTCQGCQGAELLLEGSRSDAELKPIHFRGTVKQDGVVAEEKYTFVNGFNAIVTVTLQADDLSKLDNPVLELTCREEVAGPDLALARRKRLLYEPVHPLLDEGKGYIKAGQIILAIPL